MTYTIGFRKRSNVAVLKTEVPTANHALAVIATVEQSVGELDFIRSPQEGEIGIEMLRVLAKQEAEEMSQTPLLKHPS
ncbi:hypothetical protein [Bradyrhizobium sp. Arg816]|uniref:hypothetical protein n=1 Tax=Bradyrhizobium sp. Arg816 TaxID=2998491 RepID=UPI00249E1837|nr:hypothetical protein [Bradyrhizobium sp. Arg816]MDI3567213.1 hypothetical protein [Bradyrhizobium sp. Arg816]